ncbi:MAG: bifunctional adenosylcobinamide kinase/adenosylcobinamide-phosphate guanylyltransferase [Cyanobacteria bacterium J06632_3]
MAIILITGPSRSGKSEWAEQLALQNAEKKQQQVVYVATARTNSDDAEWQARIERHRLRRPDGWCCEEVPVALAEAIAQHNKVHCLLIDSLGTWLANLIEQDDAQWQQAQAQVMSALRSTSADVILVAEETGWGIVPAYELGRRFRDRLGTLSRSVGALSEAVYLVASGYAIDLKQLGHPVTPVVSASSEV